MIFIGIDNGVTGTLGAIKNNGVASIVSIPTKKVLNYTKKKQFLNRVDGIALREMFIESFSLECLFDIHAVPKSVFCMIERPMINPRRWLASMSAVRALEATQVILETLKISHEFIDSKQWQKELLPSGLHKEELKSASLQVAMRLFPHVNFKKHKDADGLLIAEYAKRVWNARNGSLK